MNPTPVRCASARRFAGALAASVALVASLGLASSAAADPVAPPSAPTFTRFDTLSAAPSTTPRMWGDADAGSTVEIFTTSDCSGTPVATGSAADFKTFDGPGILLTVPANTSKTFYIDATNAGGTSACSDPITFTSDYIAPDAPVITSVSPGVAGVSTPMISGHVEAGASLTTYQGAGCTVGPTGYYDAADLEAGQIPLYQEDGPTTTVSIQARDAAGNPSPCSAAFVYTNLAAAYPAAPVLSTDPASPSASTSFSVHGVVPAGSRFTLYFGAGCTGAPFYYGDPADLVNGTQPLHVDPNQSLTISGADQDSAGNGSKCSDPITFVNNPTAAANDAAQPWVLPAPTPLAGPTPTPVVTPTPAPVVSAKSSVCASSQVALSIAPGGPSNSIRLVGITSAASGSKVTLTATGSSVGGTAAVSADGSFSATLPAPRAAVRSQVRYAAHIGSLDSDPVWPSTTLALTSARNTAQGERVAGQLKSVTKHSTVQVTRQVDCSKTAAVETLSPTKHGAITTTLARPTSGSALYRLQALRNGVAVGPAVPVVVSASAS